MLDKLYMQILDMSITASVVILVVLLARLLLKKAPKIISYALWLVVLLRLLCPFSMQAPFSVMPRVASVADTYELTDVPISIAGAGVAAYQAVGDVESKTGLTVALQVVETETNVSYDEQKYQQQQLEEQKQEELRLRKEAEAAAETRITTDVRGWPEWHHQEPDHHEKHENTHHHQ